MLCDIFTNEQLSKYFKKTIIVYIICLLSIIIQSLYAPSYVNLKLIIKIISKINLIFIIIITFLKLLLFIDQHQKEIISRYKIIIMMSKVFITMVSIWFLIINHHIEEKFIEYYSQKSINNQHDNVIIYVLIVIVTMLLLDLYDALGKKNKINLKSITSITSPMFYIFMNQYIVIFIAFIGFIYFNTYNKYINSTMSYIYTTTMLYLHISIYIFIILSMITTGYYIYNRYYSDKII